MLKTEGLQTNPSSGALLATLEVSGNHTYRVRATLTASVDCSAQIGGPTQLSNVGIHIACKASTTVSVDLGEATYLDTNEIVMNLNAGFTGTVQGCLILEDC